MQLSVTFVCHNVAGDVHMHVPGVAVWWSYYTFGLFHFNFSPLIALVT